MAIRKIITLCLIWGVGICYTLAEANGQSVADSEMVYKQVDTVVLKLHQYLPPDYNPSETYNAVLFFHGGGWRSGTYKAFNRQARYLAERGFVVFSADYRIYNIHQTSPFDATGDASDAFKYLIDHAKKLNIEPKQIIVGGGSAGGQLATATVFWKKQKAKPAALLLFNPVLDTGPEGFGFRRMEGRYKEISPMEHITSEQPPSLIQVGTRDKVLPVPLAEKYKRKVEEVGGRCDLVFYEGEEHSFFNQSKFVSLTMAEVDRFLVSLNLLIKE